MLELKRVQKDPNSIKDALKRRFSGINMDEFLLLDERRRKLLEEIEQLRNQKNTLSKDVADCKRSGEDASSILESVKDIGDTISSLEKDVAMAVDAVQNFLYTIPNVLHESVPFGEDETSNVEIRKVGIPREMSFIPKEHWEMEFQSGDINFEMAAKVTGSRFSFLIGEIAKLERAIGQFCLEVQTLEHLHTEVMPPFIVNKESMFGTGQLPKFEEDLFSVQPFCYYLVPTAEVPLTNMFANEVLQENSLPLCFVAMTPCFRSEAGSYGKDTKGLIRQHQFTKVEMVHFSHPESSYDQLERMVSYAENLLVLLELPFRTVVLSSGDTGFTAAKTYDIEVWLPGQNTYREISSCSNCEDFQSRRAGIRFKPHKSGKSHYIHTLNGSGLPLGRTLVAILENYQDEDGIRIPAVLKKYMNCDKIFFRK
ncbi:MAG: serine--tRNA ligase [Desulfovibrionaceae bacterium]